MFWRNQKNISLRSTYRSYCWLYWRLWKSDWSVLRRWPRKWKRRSWWWWPWIHWMGPGECRLGLTSKNRFRFFHGDCRNMIVDRRMVSVAWFWGPWFWFKWCTYWNPFPIDDLRALKRKIYFTSCLKIISPLKIKQSSIVRFITNVEEDTLVL